MILSDVDIEERCLADGMISPFIRSNLQPASVDLTLSDHLVCPRDFVTSLGVPHAVDLADIKGTAPQDAYLAIEMSAKGYTLHPGRFVLGMTAERVSVPNDLVGRVEGKSSLGRLGLMVHSTAGFLDPGFEGTITLEFYNLFRRPIVLRPYLKICQVAFQWTSSEVRTPYGHQDLNSKYQNAVEPEASRYVG